MTETSTKESRKTIVIDASPEVVFRALTDEKELTEYGSQTKGQCLNYKLEALGCSKIVALTQARIKQCETRCWK